MTKEQAQLLRTVMFEALTDGNGKAEGPMSLTDMILRQIEYKRKKIEEMKAHGYEDFVEEDLKEVADLTNLLEVVE